MPAPPPSKAFVYEVAFKWSSSVCPKLFKIRVLSFSEKMVKTISHRSLNFRTAHRGEYQLAELHFTPKAALQEHFKECRLRLREAQREAKLFTRHVKQAEVWLERPPKANEPESFLA